MAEYSPEYSQSFDWEHTLLWQARELLAEGIHADFNGFTKIESTFDRLILRDGGRSEQNLYCYIEDCDAGVLLRSVYTQCTASKDQQVIDMSALLTGGIEPSRVRTEAYLTGKWGVWIDQPDHDAAALIRAIRDHGTLPTDDQRELWSRGIDILVTAQKDRTEDTIGFTQRLIGGFISKITGLRHK